MPVTGHAITAYKTFLAVSTLGYGTHVTLATRLCAGVLLACLLLGVGAQAVAAVDSGVDSANAGHTAAVESTEADTTGDDSATTDDGYASSDLLTLDFSVKRLVVSLGFVGALVARRQNRGV